VGHALLPCGVGAVDAEQPTGCRRLADVCHTPRASLHRPSRRASARVWRAACSRRRPAWLSCSATPAWCTSW
jgi:hypothetical protein